MVACPIGTLGSVASMLAATLYQGNHDMDHKLWNIGSIERDMLHIYMQVLLEVATYQWKIHNRKIEIISLIVKFSSMSYTISRATGNIGYTRQRMKTKPKNKQKTTQTKNRNTTQF
jgi:hypothetical protein